MAHVEVCTDELDRDEYVANTGNRCFHCKSALFDAIGPLATMMNASMALGTNLDDLGDHRPGQAAATSRGAVFPLVDLGFAPARVRAHADGTVARIELDTTQLNEAILRRAELVAAVRATGFTFCALDLAGFRSGSMNALLQLTVLRS